LDRNFWNRLFVPVQCHGESKSDGAGVSNKGQHAGSEGVITVLYIIKWIPKDQDVIIDRTKRYDDPSEALAVARNLLQLNPKKIWIEDEKGVLHTDHDAILEYARGG